MDSHIDLVEDPDADISCLTFHSLANISDVCAFVRNTSSCNVDVGFINYTGFVYCTMNGDVATAVVIILFWWLFIFSGLASTANEFFCPSLAAISQSLRLSHNVAGVTFLAAGNGAADIFSAIAAIGNAKSGDAGLAFGALFGAAIAMTCVVVGTIVIVCPFRSVERPFLRDVIFSLMATFWTWYVLWDKKMTQFEALGFIILYCVYVIVVILGRYVNQKMKGRTLLTSKLGNIVGDDSEEITQPLLGGGRSFVTEITNNGSIEIIAQDSVEYSSPDPHRLLPSFLHAINPISKSDWREMGLIGKVYSCFKAPIRIVLLLTIPVVVEKSEDEKDLQNWNKHLNCLHLITGPLSACFLTQLAFKRLGDVLPVWALVLIIGVVLATVVFCTSQPDQRPGYHMSFAYLGFLVAIVWVYSFANEIVNVLQTIGIVFNLSNAILGLTFLAWGNAMGDFISDFTMARRGYPQMGVSACFGGPLFNILLGLGIPFSFACLDRGGEFQLKVNMEQMVLASGMLLSLVASLIIVPLCGFHMTRSYGIFLLVLYAVFLLVAILTETNVIPNSQL